MNSGNAQLIDRTREAALEAPAVCYCCGTLTRTHFSSPDVACRTCASCSSLLCVHKLREGDYNPWQMNSVTQTFQDALRKRRELQARAIIKRFGALLRQGPVLDYGCGQGAFVKMLLEAGIENASGADISLVGCDADLPAGHFYPLAQPWGLPESKTFSVLCMLDVLEHCEQPDEFVSRLHLAGYSNLLIKVPMLNGPIGWGAQLLSRLGKPGLLRRLLLTGEISPHYTFFSRRGLCELMSARGYKLVASLRVADVGAELPERLRSDSGEVSLGAARPLLKFVGLGLSMISPLWSDTEVFHFTRKA